MDEKLVTRRYRAVATLPHSDATNLDHRLASLLNRMGFDDGDAGAYFKLFMRGIETEEEELKAKGYKSKYVAYAKELK